MTIHTAATSVARPGDYYIDNIGRGFIAKHDRKDSTDICNGCAFGGDSGCNDAPSCVELNVHFVQLGEDESARIVSLARLKGLL